MYFFWWVIIEHVNLDGNNIKQNILKKNYKESFLCGTLQRYVF